MWGGRVHAPPHWLQAVPPLTTKLSFPAQIRRCQVLNLATREKKINAVSGEAWTAELHSEPQDYVVVPGQPWLDGFSVGAGLIRQFVALPLGAGYSVEEQLTGRADRADHPAGMSAGLRRASFWNCPSRAYALRPTTRGVMRISPAALPAILRASWRRFPASKISKSDARADCCAADWRFDGTRRVNT